MTDQIIAPIATTQPLAVASGRPEPIYVNLVISDPEVIVASWCGKAVKKRTIVEREGWSAVSAVRHDHIYEIKSTYILQPGPASLTDGVRQLHEHIVKAATYAS